MNSIEKLLQRHCPDGVEYKELWQVTIWDKKFNSVDNDKQQKVLKYKYYLAKDIEKLIDKNGDIKILTTNKKNLYTSDKYVSESVVDREIIAIPWGGIPVVQYYNGKFITCDNRIATTIDNNMLSVKYLYYFLSKNIEYIESTYRGSGIKHPYMNDILNMKIPLPPIEVQNKIVEILDTFSSYKAELSAELSARNKQCEYVMEEKFLSLKCKYNMVKIGDENIFTIENTMRRAIKKELRPKGLIPYYGANNIQDYVEGSTHEGSYVLIAEDGVRDIDNYSIQYVSGKFWANNHVHVVCCKEKCNVKYLYYALKKTNFRKFISSDNRAKLTKTKLKEVMIPLPPLDVQQEIVDKLDVLYKITNDLNEGLPKEIELREKQYQFYLNELLNFG